MKYPSRGIRTNVRPWILRIVLVAFVVGCVVWMAWVPYSPDRLLAPIPAEATVVVGHEALAPRLSRLLESPALQSFLDEMGAADAFHAPELRRILGAAGEGDAVTAFVPSLPPYDEPALVFSLWLGGRSHWVRWAGDWAGLPDWDRVDVRRGRAYWKRSIGGGVDVAVVLEEGLLFGCVSRRHEMARALWAVYDGALASWQTVAPRAERTWWRTDRPRDAGWMRWPVTAPYGLTDSLWRVIYDPVDGGRILLDSVGRPAPRSEPPDPDALRGWLAELPARPDAVLYASASNAARGLEGVGVGYAEDVAAWAHDLGARDVVVALFGDEFSGRIRGVRCPSVVVAVRNGDESRAALATRRCLDRLNQRTGAAWMMESSRLPEFGDLLLTIASTESAAYRRLAEGERFAVSVQGEWTLLGTNRSVLERLRAGSATGRRPEAPVPAWDITPLVWMDLVSGGKTVRNGLAVATLYRMSSGGGAEDPYAMVKQLTHALEPAGQLALRALPAVGNETGLEITWGP